MTAITTSNTQPITAIMPPVVEHYDAAWAAYIMAALLFLTIVIWFTRHGKSWWRIPLWAAIASGSLTPAVTTPVGAVEQAWHAPAIIVAILGFDLDGMAGFARGFVPIITWFVGFVVLFSVVHVLLQRWPLKIKNRVKQSDEPGEKIEPKHEPNL